MRNECRGVYVGGLSKACLVLRRRVAVHRQYAVGNPLIYYVGFGCVPYNVRGRVREAMKYVGS